MTESIGSNGGTSAEVSVGTSGAGTGCTEEESLGSAGTGTTGAESIDGETIGVDASAPEVPVSTAVETVEIEFVGADVSNDSDTSSKDGVDATGTESTEGDCSAKDDGGEMGSTGGSEGTIPDSGRDGKNGESKDETEVDLDSEEFDLGSI